MCRNIIKKEVEIDNIEVFDVHTDKPIFLDDLTIEEVKNNLKINQFKLHNSSFVL